VEEDEMFTVGVIGGVVAVVLLFHELSQIKNILCQIRDEAYFERTAHLLAVVDKDSNRKAPIAPRASR
jgi:hypothetical protein